MKTKLEQKFIIVDDVYTDDVNRLLDDGWTIKNMSACGNEGSSLCYVYLVRELDN